MLTYFEFNRLVSNIDSDSASLQVLIILFLYQAIIFSLVFLSLALTKQYLTENKQTQMGMKKGEKIGLILQLVSLFLAVITVYSFCSPIFLSAFSIFFVSIGVNLYCHTKNKLAISFILWGLALYVVLNFCTLTTDFLSAWIEM